MKNKLATLILLLLLVLIAPVAAQNTPANPDTNAAARAVLNYIQTINGQILSGQFGFYGGETSAESGQDQLDAVFRMTGVWPAITGADFQRPDRTPDQSVNEAVSWLTEKWNEGYLINASWHARNPCTGGSASLEDGQPVLDLNRVLPGGNCHAAWLQSLDRVAAGLQRLEDAGAVVIWRPFHEMNGAWFWWHRNSADKFIALWRHMFTYFTDTKGLDNLLWAFSPNYAWDQWAQRVDYYYPGGQYVDIVGMDKYASCVEEPIQLNQFGSYDQLVALNKPVMLLEFGLIPASGACYDRNPYPYRWDEFLTDLQTRYPRIIGFQAWEYVWQIGRDNYDGQREMMNHPAVITRNELPNFRGDLPTVTPTNTATFGPSPTPSVTASASNTPTVTPTPQPGQMLTTTDSQISVIVRSDRSLEVFTNYSPVRRVLFYRGNNWAASDTSAPYTTSLQGITRIGVEYTHSSGQLYSAHADILFAATNTPAAPTNTPTIVVTPALTEDTEDLIELYINGTLVYSSR